MVPVLKTGVLFNTVGSNPTSSFMSPIAQRLERLAVNQNVVCSNHTRRVKMGLSRLERLTLRLSGVYSNQLSYKPDYKKCPLLIN